MSTDEEKINSITEKVIGCAYRVANKLGSGFLEKCYENALAYELRKAGLSVQQQISVQVRYENIVVGEFVADLLVEGLVLVELKAIKALEEIHHAQCINYLAATKLPICLLINFGKRVQINRFAGTSFNEISSGNLDRLAAEVDEAIRTGEVSELDPDEL